MTAKEWTVLASQLAMVLKKNGKKGTEVTVMVGQLMSATKACVAISRLVKLAEKDAELSSPEERLVGAAAGRAEVWGLIMQELDEVT
jgi:hypothetical protein